MTNVPKVKTSDISSERMLAMRVQRTGPTQKVDCEHRRPQLGQPRSWGLPFACGARRRAPKTAVSPRRREIRVAAASRFNQSSLECWITRPASQVTATSRHAISFSRRFSPELCLVLPPPSIKRAQGRPGAGWHPRSAARVRKRAKEPHSSIQVTPEHPAFPAQWVDGLCRALPGAKLPSGLPHPPN